MKYEPYDLKCINDDFSVFVFSSTGEKGEILKRIEFTLTGNPGIMNLAFGDVTADGRINDVAVSNNGDRNKVLATVAMAIDIHLSCYSGKIGLF